MFTIDVEEIEWAGKRLRLETGRMARQADGAVLATYGETTVLATAVAARSAKRARAAGSGSTTAASWSVGIRRTASA